jgi:hypothetical protein
MLAVPPVSLFVTAPRASIRARRLANIHSSLAASIQYSGGVSSKSSSSIANHPVAVPHSNKVNPECTKARVYRRTAEIAAT